MSIEAQAATIKDAELNQMIHDLRAVLPTHREIVALQNILVRVIERAASGEREACEKVALEQRCERGTPWDQACTTIADAIRARGSV